MSDFRVARRPALDSGPARSAARTGIRLLPEGHVIHVLGRASDPDLESLLASIARGASDVRPTGPAQWFIVGDEPMPREAMARIFAALGSKAVCIDQSHGRVRIGIEGPMVEQVLAKGTAVDLSLPAFPIGHSATTLVGHIAAHLTRVEERAFEIIVLRSFAESLWDDLIRMSAEFA